MVNLTIAPIWQIVLWRHSGSLCPPQLTIRYVTTQKQACVGEVVTLKP